MGQGWQHARECIMGRQRDVELAAHRSQHNTLGVWVGGGGGDRTAQWAARSRAVPTEGLLGTGGRPR